jgi:hypothetical protein
LKILTTAQAVKGFIPGVAAVSCFQDNAAAVDVGGKRVPPGRPVSKRNKGLRFQDIEAARDKLGWGNKELAREASKLLRDKLRGELTPQEISKYQNWRTDPPAMIVAAMGAAVGLKEVRIPCDTKHLESGLRKLLSWRGKRKHGSDSVPVFQAAEKPGRYELGRKK